MNRVIDLAPGHSSITPEIHDWLMAVDLDGDPAANICGAGFGAYGCTREPDHEDNHVATGIGFDEDGGERIEIYAVWPKEVPVAFTGSGSGLDAEFQALATESDFDPWAEGMLPAGSVDAEVDALLAAEAEEEAKNADQP